MKQCNLIEAIFNGLFHPKLLHKYLGDKAENNNIPPNFNLEVVLKNTRSSRKIFQITSSDKIVVDE